MLIKFLKHTGAARKGQEADPDARRAIAYLLGAVVLKPRAAGGPRVPTRRATKPIHISGEAWLVSRTCAALPFQHRYASGVIAFDADDIDIAAWTQGDPALRGMTEALMRDFEDLAFAGIPEAHRPEVLWVAHTDKRRLELNFLFARAVMDSRGRLRAINPKPPEKIGIAMWEAFRDSWNHRHGWADPQAPERHRDLKLPGSVISTPPRDIEGNPTFDIRQELAIEIGTEIDLGGIASRDDVLTWLEGQGHRIKRKGRDYISVECLLSRDRSEPPDAPARYARAIRLRGDLFDQRFTSPAWLDDCGWTAGGLAPERRDMRGAADELARLRALRAAHHRDRLGWPEQAPEPEPEAPDDIEGLTCAWAPPAPDSPTGIRAKARRPSFDETRLPEDLIAKLRFVDYRTGRMWLQDGSSIEDLEDRLKAHSRSHDTIRLIIAQARLKRWSGISARGDAAFLREVTRVAFAEGLEIAGRDAGMDRIVQDELARLRAARDQTEVPHSTIGTPKAPERAQAPEAPDVAPGREGNPATPWLEEHMGRDTLISRTLAMLTGRHDADAGMPGSLPDIEPEDHVDRDDADESMSGP